MTDIHYSKTTNNDFTEVVEIIKTSIAENSFKILHIHDVQATLAGKEIEHSPYLIVEFCRAPAAKQVLDSNPMIGLMLPCKIIIFEVDGKVTVSAIRPTIISRLFPETDLGDLPERIEADIVRVVDKVI